MKTFATAVLVKLDPWKCVLAALKHCAVTMQKPILASYALFSQSDAQSAARLWETGAKSEDE